MKREQLSPRQAGPSPSAGIDGTDRRIIATLRSHPRCSMTELARRAGVARGTALSRLRRLEEEGVIKGYGPDLDGAKVGFSVTAFTTLEISQNTLEATVSQLAQIPEVMEVHTITGSGDLLCRISATSNDHLHQVIQAVVAIPEVTRSSSDLCLRTSLRRELADLIVHDCGPD